MTSCRPIMGKVSAADSPSIPDLHPNSEQSVLFQVRSSVHLEIAPHLPRKQETTGKLHKSRASICEDHGLWLFTHAQQRTIFVHM